MKKLMIKLTAILFLGVSMLSCEKEIAQNNPPNEEQNIQEKISWSVPIQNLEQELNAIFSEDIETWEEMGIKKESSLLIETTKDKVYFYVLSSSNSIISKKIVCEGSGYSFASCAKAWLEENPKRCLTIWYEGETFYADDDCVMP